MKTKIINNLFKAICEELTELSYTLNTSNHNRYKLLSICGYEIEIKYSNIVDEVEDFFSGYTVYKVSFYNVEVTDFCNENSMQYENIKTELNKLLTNKY